MNMRNARRIIYQLVNQQIGLFLKTFSSAQDDSQMTACSDGRAGNQPSQSFPPEAEKRHPHRAWNKQVHLNEKRTLFIQKALERLTIPC
jgi:hypothetical protein